MCASTGMITFLLACHEPDSTSGNTVWTNVCMDAESSGALAASDTELGQPQSA